MLIDYLIGGVVAVLLLAYLVYALLRPERF
jgi:K+-transporting ATPase KdpF subunit